MLEEHRELIACIKAQTAEGAAQAIAKHVGGSGHHIIERMRVSRHAKPHLANTKADLRGV